jgi:hypothetical protein
MMVGTDSILPKSDQPTTTRGMSNNPNRILKNGYMDKTVENSQYEVTTPLIGNYIKYMKDHVVIRKLMGTWLS